jgi:hypothetical protein
MVFASDDLMHALIGNTEDARGQPGFRPFQSERLSSDYVHGGKG